MELVEKLGRQDLCPCGSGRRFQSVLPEGRPLRRRRTTPLLSGTRRPGRRAATRAFFPLSAPHRTRKFLNCQGSLSSRSSGNRPGRLCSGVQSV
nr:SEC-C metal-binding domain-containing protein [Methylopila sp. Yamaguchi]